MSSAHTAAGLQARFDELSSADPEDAANRAVDAALACALAAGASDLHLEPAACCCGTDNG